MKSTPARYALDNAPTPIVVAFRSEAARFEWINKSPGQRRTITVAELKQQGWRYPFYDYFTPHPNPPDLDPNDVYWTAFLKPPK